MGSSSSFSFASLAAAAKAVNFVKLNKVIAKSQRKAEAAKEAKLKDERAADSAEAKKLAAEKEALSKEMREAEVQSKKILGTSSSIFKKFINRPPLTNIVSRARRLIARFQRESRRCIAS